MPVMSSIERSFCQSPPWRAFTKGVVLPWAIGGVPLRGDVLELGCGSGAMAEALLDAHPDVRLVATDLDPRMAASARSRLARFGDRARVETADATELSYPDDSFDAILSFIMLHHVMRWERALDEAVRVAKPGGVIVGYDLLNTLPMRLLHQAEGKGFRMMTLDALRAAVGGLPLERRTVRPDLGGLVVRFRLQVAGERA